MSNIERQINPTVPTMAAIMANAESTFSLQCVFGTSAPLCLNHLSAAKERSRKIVVIHDPAMNRGLSSVAPTSDLGIPLANQPDRTLD